MKANERLKAIMASCGITQTDLANQSGVAQVSIHRMIIGTQNINWKVLKTLRTIYRVDINKFFE